MNSLPNRLWRGYRRGAPSYVFGLWLWNTARQWRRCYTPTGNTHRILSQYFAHSNQPITSPPFSATNGSNISSYGSDVIIIVNGAPGAGYYWCKRGLRLWQTNYPYKDYCKAAPTPYDRYFDCISVCWFFLPLSGLKWMERATATTTVVLVLHPKNALLTNRKLLLYSTFDYCNSVQAIDDNLDSLAV